MWTATPNNHHVSALWLPSAQPKITAATPGICGRGLQSRLLLSYAQDYITRPWPPLSRSRGGTMSRSYLARPGYGRCVGLRNVHGSLTIARQGGRCGSHVSALHPVVQTACHFGLPGQTSSSGPEAPACRTTTSQATSTSSACKGALPGRADPHRSPSLPNGPLFTEHGGPTGEAMAVSRGSGQDVWAPW